MPRERLLPHVRALAEEIAENAPLAVQTIKRTINNWADRRMGEALRFEAATASANFVSDDMQLGYKAMAGKRRRSSRGSNCETRLAISPRRDPPFAPKEGRDLRLRGHRPRSA